MIAVWISGALVAGGTVGVVRGSVGPVPAHAPVASPTARRAQEERAVEARAAAKTPGDAVEAVRVANAETPPSTDMRLASALHDEDPIVRIEAIDEIVARGDVAALDELLRLEVREDDPAARAVMGAIGALGGATSDPSSKRAAANRLLEMLREEHARSVQDEGNLLVLVEAIGAAGDPLAAPILEAELGRPPLDAAGWTTVVASLGAIGTRDSVPALERLRTAAGASSAGDAFDRELARELTAAVDEAIARIEAR